MRVALVTGGGRGIGAACARALAADGWTVVVNYLRDEAAAAGVARDVGGHALQGDVTTAAGAAALFASLDALGLGPLRGLVSNAGGSADFRIADMTEAEYDRVMDGNLRSAAFCAREAVRRMGTDRGGQGGAIVNIGSRAAEIGGAFEFIHYAASKGAVDSLTFGLAREVVEEGIRVNAVAPGMIDTDIHAAAGIPERVGRIVPMVPMKRLGTPEEVAELVLWLASDAASYVTGEVVKVSGGR